MPTFTMPQEQPGWWDTLSRLFSPREASAEVRPMDTGAGRVWGALQSGETIQPLPPPMESNPADGEGQWSSAYIPLGDPRAAIMQQIAQRAQAHPAMVMVDSDPARTGPMPPNLLGQFRPGNAAQARLPHIALNARPAFSPDEPPTPSGLPQPYPRTLAHELLHFLTTATAQDRGRLGLTLPQPRLAPTNMAQYETPEHEMINRLLEEQKQGQLGMRLDSQMPPADLAKQQEIARYLLQSGPPQGLPPGGREEYDWVRESLQPQRGR
jgi:hypothetical protein